MEYEFKNKVSVFDFFGMAMANTYKLPLGLVNVIFTASLVALSLKFWNQAGDVLQVFMLLGCLIFPVFQPFFILLRSKRQVEMIPRDLELKFDNQGLTLYSGGARQHMSWDKLGMTAKRNYVIVFSGGQNGYIINNRMMGKNKKDFIMFLKEHIK